MIKGDDILRMYDCKSRKRKPSSFAQQLDLKLRAHQSSRTASARTTWGLRHETSRLFSMPIPSATIRGSCDHGGLLGETLARRQKSHLLSRLVSSSSGQLQRTSVLQHGLDRHVRRLARVAHFVLEQRASRVRL